MKPKSTADVFKDQGSKTLLLTMHGWGKTHQCANYQKHFGKGFIISGESGLKTLATHDIDYLAFSSFDDPSRNDPDRGVYSFREIARFVRSTDFAKEGYKWIAIDSLTELSERAFEHAQRLNEGNKNGFDIWQDYGDAITGAVKWIRDLPYHVLVTCLVTETKNAMGEVEYWPMVKQNKVSQHVPSLFDNVFCGDREEIFPDGGGEPRVRRVVYTTHTRGWRGKVRDPHGTVQPVEDGDNIALLLQKIQDGGKTNPPKK